MSDLMTQVPGLMKAVEATVGRVSSRISALILVVLFILHIFACLFHYVALVNVGSTTWIDASGIVDAQSTLDRYVRMLLLPVPCIVSSFSFQAMDLGSLGQVCTVA